MISPIDNPTIVAVAGFAYRTVPTSSTSAIASELCSMRAVARCDAFFGGRGLMARAARGSFARNADHFADGRRACEHFSDSRFAKRPHTRFAARLEQPRAVGVFRHQ